MLLRGGGLDGERGPIYPMYRTFIICGALPPPHRNAVLLKERESERGKRGESCATGRVDRRSFGENHPQMQEVRPETYTARARRGLGLRGTY